MVGLIAASYLALIGLLTAQAMAGLPVLSVDPLSLGAGSLWAILTMAGLMIVAVAERLETQPSSLTCGA